MPRITPQPWKKIECVLLALGFEFERQKGSHRIYIKGDFGDAVLPQYKELSVNLILNIIRETGIDRDTFLKHLENC